MIRKFIPGALALGLIATASAETAAADAATKPAAPAAQAPAAPPAPPAPKLDPAVLKTDSSYALGFRSGASFGEQFGRFGINGDDLDMESFSKGFSAALKSGKPEMEEAKLAAAMQALGDMLQEREKKIAAANAEEGKKFLEENGKRKGVITTKSGLQYEVLAKGGDQKYVAPKEGEEDNKQFLVNYKGTFANGKQFDASPEGQPFPMTLQVIPGFKEALTTMPVGAKWKLFIPSELGYGEKRMNAEMGPNSTLIFELELVKIEDAPAQPAMPFQMPEGAAPAGE